MKARGPSRRYRKLRLAQEGGHFPPLRDPQGAPIQRMATRQLTHTVHPLRAATAAALPGYWFAMLPILLPTLYVPIRSPPLPHHRHPSPTPRRRPSSLSRNRSPQGATTTAAFDDAIVGPMAELRHPRRRRQVPEGNERGAPPPLLHAARPPPGEEAGDSNPAPPAPPARPRPPPPQRRRRRSRLAAALLHHPRGPLRLWKTLLPSAFAGHRRHPACPHRMEFPSQGFTGLSQA